MKYCDLCEGRVRGFKRDGTMCYHMYWYETSFTDYVFRYCLDTSIKEHKEIIMCSYCRKILGDNFRIKPPSYIPQEQYVIHTIKVLQNEKEKKKRKRRKVPLL